MSSLLSECRDLLAAERYQEAHRRLLEEGSLDPARRALLGRALSGMGRFDEAEEQFRAALSEWPDCHEAEAGLGLIDWLAGRHEKALARLDAALRIEPQSGRYRGLRGLVQVQLKNVEAALQDFRAAYELGDRDPAPLLAKAQILIAQGQLQAGQEALSQAAECGAEESALGSLQGALARLRGDHTEALEGYLKALQGDPGRVALWWEAVGLASQVDRPRMGELLEQALGYHPDDERLLVLAAATRREAGQLEVATELLRQAVERQPESPVLWQLLGTYLREAHDSEASLHCFEKALALRPDSAKAHFGKGLVTSERQEALASFQRAVELEPGNVVFQYHYGAVLSALGRYQEALLPLDKAVALDPTFWRAYHERSICYESLGRFVSAKQERAKCDEVRAHGRDEDLSVLEPDPLT